MAAAVGVMALPAGPASAKTSGWTIAQQGDPTVANGVTALSVAPAGGAWAGGFQAVGGHVTPTVQRLAGGAWVAVPAPADELGRIEAVAPSSSTVTWAFGGSIDQNYGARWNGEGWTTTSLTPGFRVEDGVAPTSDEAWAVGVIGGDRNPSGYAEHWTGGSWQQVTLPASAEAISAVPGNDVWAVGQDGLQPGAMRWDGTEWKLQTLPRVSVPTGGWAALHDVIALSSTNVWAVGGVESHCGEDGDDVCAKPLVMHFDGTKWTSTVEAQAADKHPYRKVASDGAGGVWLVRDSAYDPTLVHEAGGQRTEVPVPRPAGSEIAVADLAAIGTTVWAAGEASPLNEPSNSVYLKTG
ncbi:hypothetical protein OG417_15260 [Actinoallomurus sp. NBC_01490]|uniref:hypothetical protein n=1 Tax=Actinoallomurus sp. NBC_01490 TaxID=2903557 RepID=UPI002E379EFB|nr:hypothetical protein [Actinoallomurus sp. NBC_01490]